MEKRQIRVVWQINAEKSLLKFHKYIAADSPINANRFIDRLFEFGNKLNDYPEKYPLNRFPKYKNRNYRTAVFEHDYIFFYRFDSRCLYVCNIMHTSRLR